MRTVLATLCSIVVLVASGCMSSAPYASVADLPFVAAYSLGESERTERELPVVVALSLGESERTELVESTRKLIWRASLTLEVANVVESVEQAIEIVKEAGGYVQEQSDSGEESAALTLRVPDAALEDVMDRLEDLGKVEYRHLASKDVTEQYIDLEARLKNLTALRDRLRQLLDQAKGVKDILTIEKELSRVQTELDSVEGRLRSLKGRVANARIDLSLRRKPILGPLGAFFKGLGWAIEKMFVIRE